MSFVSRQTVRFCHVDQASTVFYPRYFEMLNAAMEDYFSQVVSAGFGEMHQQRGLGVPTVSLESELLAPSRLHDALDFHFDVEAVGASSVRLAIAVRCGDELRLRVRVVLVCMDLATRKATPWPDDMRPPAAVAAATL